MLVCAALAAGGCHAEDGVSKSFITDHGEKRCAFDRQLRTAVADAGFDGKVGKYPAGFDQVIVHVGDQDYADSADSTDLFDVRGALEICRWRIGEEYLVETWLYYFGPRDDRTRLKDAVAWRYALDEVDNGTMSRTVEEADASERAVARRMERAELGEPVAVDVTGQRASVVALRADGDGASAALSITMVGYVPDPDAPPRSLSGKSMSGPLPSAAKVDRLVRSLARQLDER